MIRSLFSIFVIVIANNSYAQTLTIDEITNEICKIETDSTLTITKRHQIEGQKITLDGGYLLKIWHQGHKIFKIVEDIGLSYGSIQTTVYLTNNTPIKIIETEKNFAETPTGLNYKKLNKTYKVTHSILNWKHQKTIIKEVGTRVFNTPKKTILDYKLLIDSAKQTIDE